MRVSKRVSNFVPCTTPFVWVDVHHAWCTGLTENIREDICSTNRVYGLYRTIWVRNHSGIHIIPLTTILEPAVQLIPKLYRRLSKKISDICNVYHIWKQVSPGDHIHRYAFKYESPSQTTLMTRMFMCKAKLFHALMEYHGDRINTSVHNGMQ